MEEATRFMLFDIQQKLLHTRFCLESVSEELNMLVNTRRELLRRMGVENQVEALAKEMANLAVEVERLRKLLKSQST